MSVESLSLTSDRCFQIVDGLILVLNCSMKHVVAGGKKSEENILSAFVESVLKCVKEHGLSLLVYLDGFDGKMSVKSELNLLMELVKWFGIDFSEDAVIVGNCEENYAISVVSPREKHVVREHVLDTVVKLVSSPVESQKTFQFENLMCFQRHEAFDAIEECLQGGTLVIYGVCMVPHLSKPNRYH